MLRKPGEQNNPVVETVNMNDLRYNMYGGARYPAPAVVGNFASAAPVAPRPSTVVRRSVTKKRAPEKPSVEIYRGTKSDSYKVGGYGR